MAVFVDKAKITIKAGSGGDGAVSFHREKYVAAGGPDGGDGGKGGDVIFIADDNFSSLEDFRFKRKYIAENGANGGERNKTGRNAPDTVIKVPRGTVIKDSETGRIIADISGDEPVIVAHGGKGGKGNARFATPTRQVPKFAKPGFPGQKLEVTLELKLIADVGLVGFPNVGKSTLISVVSAAKPIIANYPFTTLTPVLGTVKVDDNSSFVIADIPGLIEGASEGVGLGHEFLRHVERCRLIVHIVDVSGYEGRDPISDYEIIKTELEKFSPELAAAPVIVAANKCDIAPTENIEKFADYIKSQGLPCLQISAVAKMGTKELINLISAELAKLPPVLRYEPEPLPEIVIDNREFNIHFEDEIYFVEADFLTDIIRMINPDDWSSLQYMQRVLIDTGIIKKLEEMGIAENDTVDISGFRFEFIY
ncbi:MAG: GTPase ObgE [Ruminococcus sp.]|jgi:GTP-binding protein|nr:GTPase ObgE [Ruminococcus sp.]